MNIDSIITEWTYRLEKGYPDCPEDYIELRNVLRERTDLPIEEQDAIVRRAMGLEEAVNISGNEFADLLEKISAAPTRLSQIQILADYTKDHTTLGLSKGNFTDVNFGNYSEDPSKYQITNVINSAGNVIEFNINAKFDDIIEQLALNLIGENISADTEWLPGQEKGRDGILGNNIQFEIKGSKGSDPNTMFQTSFPSADTENTQKYYIFVNHNNDRQNLVFKNVSVVSSDLLRKVLYGESIYNEFNESDVSETLENQIQQGLDGFKFKEHIVAALTTGDTAGFKRQFRIGNNVSVRFLIFIEPKRFGSASDGINEEEGYEI